MPAGFFDIAAEKAESGKARIRLRKRYGGQERKPWKVEAVRSELWAGKKRRRTARADALGAADEASAAAPGALLRFRRRSKLPPSLKLRRTGWRTGKLPPSPKRYGGRDGGQAGALPGKFLNPTESNPIRPLEGMGRMDSM